MEPFGSYVMDMFTATSDLDLSLNFSADETSSFPREKKISALRKFAKVLYAHQSNSSFPFETVLAMLGLSFES